MPDIRTAKTLELTRDEIQRVHDLVRTSFGTVEWIVAAATDDSGDPPSRLLVKGLLESVLDDPGESPLIGDLFTSVADTREDVGLPAGLPSPNWHSAAGEIIARVCSSIRLVGRSAEFSDELPRTMGQSFVSKSSLSAGLKSQHSFDRSRLSGLHASLTC
jgi:hypothetical protein